MLDKLETELKLRGFSSQTIKAYLIHNKKFLNFISKEPAEIEEDDIKQYLAYLITEKQLNPRSIALVLSALNFFYKEVLKKPIGKIKTPKLPKKLPIVFIKEEVKKIISKTKNFKHKLLIEFLYSSGLRVSEITNLKIKDLELNEKFQDISRYLGGGSNFIRTIKNYQKLLDLDNLPKIEIDSCEKIYLDTMGYRIGSVKRSPVILSEYDIREIIYNSLSR